MKQGALIFDERSDRYDIRFDLADYYTLTGVCALPRACRHREKAACFPV